MDLIWHIIPKRQLRKCPGDGRVKLKEFLN
jgi:hypothetical protein